MINRHKTLFGAIGNGLIFGENYAPPSPLPGGVPTSITFSPAGDAIVFSHANSPFISAYQWSFANGFGARYANPAVLPSAAPGQIDFTPNGSHIVGTQFVGGNSSLFAYSWSSSTGFGSRQTVALSGLANVRGLKVSPSGNHIAVTGVDLPTLKPISIVPWTGSAFGTPTYFSSTTSDTRTTTFSPDGNFVAVVGVNLGINVYPFSAGVLGTPFASGAGGTTTVDFTPSGNAIAWGGPGGEILRIAAWSNSGFGSFLPSPSVSSLINGVNSIAFSPLGNLLAIGANSSSIPLRVYRWLGNGIGDQLANPITLPSGAVISGRGIAFSPSGNAMVVCSQASPFIVAYKISALI